MYTTRTKDVASLYRHHSRSRVVLPANLLGASRWGSSPDTPTNLVSTSRLGYVQSVERPFCLFVACLCSPPAGWVPTPLHPAAFPTRLKTRRPQSFTGWRVSGGNSSSPGNLGHAIGAHLRACARARGKKNDDPRASAIARANQCVASLGTRKASAQSPTEYAVGTVILPSRRALAQISLPSHSERIQMCIVQ